MTKKQEVIIHREDNFELVIINGDDLEVVTGGGPVGDAWNWVKGQVGRVFSGINIGVANGDNNRVAVGNQGPVTLGDNSPIR